jgi:hypothetical protein
MHADSPSCAKGLCVIDESSCTGAILRVDNIIISKALRVAAIECRRSDLVSGVVPENVPFMHLRVLRNTVD